METKSWTGSSEPAFGEREIDVLVENYIKNYLQQALIPALASNARIIAAEPGRAKLSPDEYDCCITTGEYLDGMLSHRSDEFALDLGSTLRKNTAHRQESSCPVRWLLF